MLVECIFNSGKDVPIENRSFSETDETSYSFLEIGVEHTVYGLMFMSYRIEYLVCISNGKPVWVPANLFKIKESKISPNWAMCITYLNEDYRDLYDSFKIQAIVSYDELVSSYSHYAGILERESDHMMKFYLEKEKIDKEFDKS